MGFYDYANYNSLSDDQKLLWWFDEYLRHDLVLMTTNKGYYSDATGNSYSTRAVEQLVVLVERHTIYNYNWADNYSYYIWELLSSNLVYPYSFAWELRTQDVEITIPSGIGETVIITCFVASSRVTMLERLRIENNDFLSTPTVTLVKHQYFFKTGVQPTVVTIKCCKYSVVVTSDITINVPSEFLCSNIANWKNEFVEQEIIQYYSTGSSSAEWNYSFSVRFGGSTPPAEVMLESARLSGTLANGGIFVRRDGYFVPYTTSGTVQSRGIPYSQLVNCQLIYAKPTLTMFVPANASNSIFASNLQSLPPNQVFGSLFSNLLPFELLFATTATFYFVNFNSTNAEAFTASSRGTAPLTSTAFSDTPAVIGTVYLFTVRFQATTSGAPDLVAPDEIQPISYLNADDAEALLQRLLLQTALISPSNSNLREIVRVNSQGKPVDFEGNETTDRSLFVYDINEDYIEEYVMGAELMIQEIHACLGAGEFAYYLDNGEPKPYKMHIARTLQTFARAYGVAFKPNGEILPTRQRVNIPFRGGSATIPDGWARGQFADNEGGTSVGQTGGEVGEERTGIAYQNRCNVYENLDDDNKGNDVLLNGDIVLCENFLQLFESYLEDLDKGLNWQEMGSGLVPNADGTNYTTFEGMGTLLAEIAYTLSSLSANIQQTHVLALKTYSTTLENLKGLGLPTELGELALSLGEDNPSGGSSLAYLSVPQLSANAVTLHKRLMDVLTNLAVLQGSTLKTEESGGVTP